MLDMMKDVIDSGTGSKIRWKYKFNTPMAGKTGTTNNKTDAWFIGFTPQIAMGVWVGVDDPSISLGERQFGSVAALPIFADAITDIYDYGSFNSGSKIVYLDEKEDWSEPSGIVEVKICKETLDIANNRWCKSISEIYLKNHTPKKNCQKHINTFTKYK
jgi:penicillin-binding protein 1A